MRGWIDKLTGETAEQLKTRLETLHDYVAQSREAGATIAYSQYGLILRQREVADVWECHGLTENAAKLLIDLENDMTSNTTYFRDVGDNGEYAVVTIITGTKTTVVAMRENEAAAWKATITTVTYSATDANGWSTTRPTETVGITTGVRRTSKQLYNFQGNILFQNCETKTIEYRYLSYESALAKVTSLNSDMTGDWKNAVCQLGEGVLAVTTWCAVAVFVEHNATMRYIDPQSGWTVIDTANDYTAAAQYGDGTGGYSNWRVNGQQITAKPFVRVAYTQQS